MNYDLKHIFAFLRSLALILSTVNLSLGQSQKTEPLYAQYIEIPALELEAKKLIIFPFEDKSNNAWSYWKYRLDSTKGISDYLVDQLLQENRGLDDPDKLYFSGFTTKVFELVCSMELNDELERRGIKINPTITTAINAGKALNAGAIVIGSFSYVCNSSISQTISIRANIKIIDTNTSKTLFDRDLSSQQTSFESDTLNQSIEILFEDIANQFADIVTPKYVLIKREMVEMRKASPNAYKMKPEDRKHGNFGRQGIAAYNKIKRGNIYEALSIYETIYNKALGKLDSDVTYNAGIIWEATGDFEKALEALQLTCTLEPSRGIFEDARKRLIEVIKYTRNRGIQVKPYVPSEAVLNMVGKLKTRSDVSHVISAYALPKKNSLVVEKLEGGMTLDILGEYSKEWVKIKLPTGKEGYILVTWTE